MTILKTPRVGNPAQPKYTPEGCSERRVEYRSVDKLAGEKMAGTRIRITKRRNFIKHKRKRGKQFFFLKGRAGEEKEKTNHKQQSNYLKLERWDGPKDIKYIHSISYMK